jgi:hypothetical protein
MPDSNDPPSLNADGDDMVFGLIEGILRAFSRDPDKPQCPENERTRLAEALLSIASFIHGLPHLGPSYANHFAELASALNDWNKGANPSVLKREKGISTPLGSLESRAIANLILAIEALVASRVSWSDRYRRINTSDAIGEILRKFTRLKGWVDNISGLDIEAKTTIQNWRREFSRQNDKKGVAANDEAIELLTIGRDLIKSKNGDIEELHKLARQRAQAAERDALRLGV